MTPPPLLPPSESFAGCTVEALDGDCFCITRVATALRDDMQLLLRDPDLMAWLDERLPTLFSARPVFITHAQRERMVEIIRAVTSVVALPCYREAVLARSPAIAGHDPGGALSVFFGYDFHVTAETLGLIEINTNAGGAMLNTVLTRAQHRCCPSLPDPAPAAEAMEAAIVAMFRNEWRLSERAGPMRSIAIVDDAPARQYLYPEFVLFQRLFRQHGLQAVIADPSELTLQRGVLRQGDTAIDLVYNRLTDFSLQTPGNGILREAYLQQAVVLTPHPQAHALYADKRNLALLSDEATLRALGVPAATRDILLSGIPRTELVAPANAERLWRERGGLFFKPATGFGSRAAYRGDKLTRRTWDDILAGEYVAQSIITPGQRPVSRQPGSQALKFDIRNYVYDGLVQWSAARLYQGQTTNFRTPGGGFAPVYLRIPA